MNRKYDLERFVSAQKYDYERALKEMRSENKETDWIRYTFPQLKELGRSHNSRHYGIRNTDEAAQYLAHPILGKRLLEISSALLDLSGNDPYEIWEELML